MRVLMLGGSGLISSETTRALLELGHDTYALTRGKRAFRISEVSGRSVKNVVADRHDKTALKKVLAEVDPEVVIDLICYQPQEMKDLIEVRNRSLKHLVFVSTVCALGGELAQHPATGTTERRPSFDYGRNKMILEDIVLDASRSGIIAGTNFRPSSTDGPGAWLSGSLWCRHPILFELLKKQRPIIVCAGGVLCHHGSTRDVGLALALACGRSNTFGRTYNVVGDECITQAEWTRRTASGIGAPEPKIVEIPADWLVKKLKGWNGLGFLQYIWRYHGCFDTSELKRDIPEWRPELKIADNARLTWEWGVSSGEWEKAQGAGVQVPEAVPEKLIEDYTRAAGA
ncbi:MAG TPA: NAD-dependent epimerase/dehydratase family protein [Planctomycetota bacterium]|nr:NAD-dependent epimerase/dehydratase family protein [Planctomycetota bacterium]